IRRQPHECRFSHGRGDPGFQPAHDPELRSVAIVHGDLVFRSEIVRHLIVNAHRQPNFRRYNLHRADETFRCNTDDRERPAVNEYLRAERVWIEVVPLPIIVTDDRDRRVAAGRLFFRQKCATARERDTEHGEIVRTDYGSERTARISFLPETDQREIETQRVAEDGVLFADIAISRIRKTAELFRILLVLGKE